MPIKRPVVTEMDLQRARQIVCSLMPLKRLSEDDAEIVARAIAQGIACGRKQGLEMAQVDMEGLTHRAACGGIGDHPIRRMED